MNVLPDMVPEMVEAAYCLTCWWFLHAYDHQQAYEIASKHREKHREHEVRITTNTSKVQMPDFYGPINDDGIYQKIYIHRPMSYLQCENWIAGGSL